MSPEDRRSCPEVSTGGEFDSLSRIGRRQNRLAIGRETCSVTFRGAIYHFRFRRAFVYLCDLIEHVSLEGSELAGGQRGPGASVSCGVDVAYEEGNLGPRMDEAAKNAYFARLARLTDLIEDAELFGRSGEAERHRAEQEGINRTLGRDLDRWRHPRVDGDRGEMDAASVRRAFDRLFKVLRGVDETLARFLSERFVQDGRSFRYIARPGDPDWGIDR